MPVNRNDLVRRMQRADDQERDNLRESVTSLIAEAHAQHLHGHAKRLSAALEPRGAKRAPQPAAHSPMMPEDIRALLHEPPKGRRLAELVLPRDTRRDVREFLDEFTQIALLRSHSLEPRHTVLLVGPPGTGKTSLASAVAEELRLPFFVVRYDGLVGSYLGETASRLQQIVDYASRMPCVLFFDEFETVGKERGDNQETGEIKRVVSSLLLHMDSLPSHCVVVCATNHPELLDRAVWRRFELRLELPLPGRAELREWFTRTEKDVGRLGITADEFIETFDGESFSEIEAITLDVRRAIVLSKGEASPTDAFKIAIERWVRRRAVAGMATNGATTDRKNKPRARARTPADRSKSALSKGGLL
jgi:SpoVK/Ycf46/Vps4 family AAA+-type ATPase